MRSVGDLILAGFSQLKNARIENLAADPSTPQAGQIWYNTTDSVFRGFNGSTVITFATGGSTAILLQEIDAIETAVGLNSDGTYTAPAGSNYLGSTTTVLGAASALDAAIKTNADAIAAETTRATGAEGTLTTNLAAEVTRATGVETQLQTDLTAEVTRATAAEGTLTTNLAAEVARATAAEGALDTRVTSIEGSYIKKDGSVAYTADQSMASNKLTNVGTPVDNGDAANKAYVDSKIGSLGNAFNYVGTIEGGVDIASALDLSTLTDVGAGDYYKVITSGYVKDTAAGTEYFLNAGDGVVKNITATGWDKFDNTDSQVQGTTNFITVTGTTDTGYTVDLAQNAKDRLSTVESGLAAEITRATAAEGQVASDLAAEVTRATTAEGTLTTNLAAEVTRATGAEATLTTNLSNEVTRATTAEGALQTEIDAVETAVGLNADGTFAAVTGSNYLGSATTVIGLSSALDTALKALSDSVGASTFIYDGSSANTTHVVAHNLGQKYCQVTVVDSSDKVILADSITFDTANQLTVAFSSAITCKVVVTR